MSLKIISFKIAFDDLHLLCLNLKLFIWIPIRQPYNSIEDFSQESRISLRTTRFFECFVVQSANRYQSNFNSLMRTAPRNEKNQDYLFQSDSQCLSSQPTKQMAIANQFRVGKSYQKLIFHFIIFAIYIRRLSTTDISQFVN